MCNICWSHFYQVDFWRQALGLFQTLQRATVEGNRISFNATISACEKAGEWQQALQIFQQMAKDPWNNGEVKGKKHGVSSENRVMVKD